MRTIFSGAALSLLLAVSMIPTSAEADSLPATATDATGDVVAVGRDNITSVSVRNERGLGLVVLTVRHRPVYTGGLAPYGPKSTYSLALDTDASRAGEEWSLVFGDGQPVEMSVASEWGGTTPHPRWFNRPKQKGVCAKTVVRRLEPGKTTILIRKKKGCFTAGRLRIRARVDSRINKPEHSHGVATDLLPHTLRGFTSYIPVGSAKTFSDTADRVNWWNDIQRVRAEVSDGRLEFVMAHRRSYLDAGSLRVYIDTDADDVPDWQLWLTTDGEPQSGLLQMEGWAGGTPRDSEACLVYISAFGDYMSRLSTSMAVPPECLGNPASFRYAVRLEEYPIGQHHPIDWLGGVQHWSTSLSLP